MSLDKAFGLSCAAGGRLRPLCHGPPGVLPAVTRPRWPSLQEAVTDLALPCDVSGLREPLVLGISGKPRGLQVAIGVSKEESEDR